MNEDTLHLLSECAAGTDMAIRSLEDVLKNSAEGPLQKRLLDSKRQHEQLAAQAEDRLLHGHQVACPLLQPVSHSG